MLRRSGEMSSEMLFFFSSFWSGHARKKNVTSSCLRVGFLSGWQWSENFSFGCVERVSPRHPALKIVIFDGAYRTILTIKLQNSLQIKQLLTLVSNCKFDCFLIYFYYFVQKFSVFTWNIWNIKCKPCGRWIARSLFFWLEAKKCKNLGALSSINSYLKNSKICSFKHKDRSG